MSQYSSRGLEGQKTHRGYTRALQARLSQQKEPKEHDEQHIAYWGGTGLQMIDRVDGMNLNHANENEH
jgi:hypothetical protein